MVEQRKYIGIFLLAGFLIPQAANAVHHFILPHPSYTVKSEVYSFNSPGLYEYHDCNYHLTGTDSGVLEKDNWEEVRIPESITKPKRLYTGILIDKYYNNYYLRGPPSEKDQTELNDHKK